MIVYKVQYKEPDATVATYKDDGDWAPCEDCMSRMRVLFEEDYRREIRVIDERGVVVASTAGTPLRPFDGEEVRENCRT